MTFTVRTVLAGAVATAGVAALLIAGTAGAAPRVKPRVVAFTPDGYVRVETVVTKTKERKYYVMTADKPIEFSLNGPTTVDISTRLLFTMDMKGEQRYTVSVTQDTLTGHAQEVAAMTFTTRKSPVSTLASAGPSFRPRGSGSSSRCRPDAITTEFICPAPRPGKPGCESWFPEARFARNPTRRT
jgi:hypothetical protein